MKPIRTALSLAALAAACAGPGGYQLNAAVYSMPHGAHDASALASAAGAKVSLACPNQEQQELGRTGADGTLHVEGAAAIPLACAVVIAQPGGKPTRYGVADLCLEESPAGCRDLSIRATVAAADGTL